MGSPQTATTPAFISTTAHIATHPKALAVYCSDGRFTEAVEELFRHLGHDRLDTLTLPGGPGLFDAGTSNLFVSRDVLKSALFLIEAHHIERVVLIAHEGCGYYRQRYQYTSQKIPDQQVADLKSAAVLLTGPRRNLRADCFYASVVEGHVAFSPVG